MTEIINIAEGEVIIMDRCGSRPILTTPLEEKGVLLDIGGRLNKLEEQEEHRYIFSPEQATEVVASLLISSYQACDSREELDAELGKALDREIKARGL